MKVLRCVACGGHDLSLSPVPGALRCKFCKTNSIVNTYNKDVINSLNLAANLRSHFIFDRAETEYKNTLRLNPDCFEAFFGMALCKYGIEYEKLDTGEFRIVTRKYIEDLPLINTDYDVKKAIALAPDAIKEDYVRIAKEIYVIQKELSVLKRNNYKFDVYLSYSEIDPLSEQECQDLNQAREAYDWLTGKGLKVFFREVTLSKIPKEKHEPYIHSAILNSKTMVVFGSQGYLLLTDSQKNEWGKFLDLINKEQKNPNGLIYAFDERRPDIIPIVFENKSHAAIGKFGGLQSLLTYIGDVLKIDFGGDTTVESLSDKGNHDVANDQWILNSLMLTNISLIDEQFDLAYDRAEEIILKKKDCAQAYLYLLLAEFKASRVKDLLVKNVPFWNSPTYDKYLLFAKPDEKEAIERAVKEKINNTLETEKEKVSELLGSDDEQAVKVAVQRLTEQAKDNNIDAMIRLAECYEQGAGVPQSFEQAMKWYAVAENEHSMVASYKLAQYFENGLGVNRDLTEAARHYTLSAERGHLDSLYTLAEYYLFGKGVDQNYSVSVRLFRQAHKEGHQEAGFNLAKCFNEGKGVIQAPDVAFKLFLENAKRGHLASMEKVAYMIKHGEGTPIDKKELSYWTSKVNAQYKKIGLSKTVSLKPEKKLTEEQIKKQEEKNKKNKVKQELAAQKQQEKNEAKNAAKEAKQAAKQAAKEEKEFAKQSKDEDLESAIATNDESSSQLSNNDNNDNIKVVEEYTPTDDVDTSDVPDFDANSIKNND